MKQLVRQREDEIQLLPSTLQNCNAVLFIRLQRLRHRPRLRLRRLRSEGGPEGGRYFRHLEDLRPDLRRDLPRHCCCRLGQITILHLKVSENKFTSVGG